LIEEAQSATRDFEKEEEGRATRRCSDEERKTYIPEMEESGPSEREEWPILFGVNDLRQGIRVIEQGKEVIGQGSPRMLDYDTLIGRRGRRMRTKQKTPSLDAEGVTRA
jgi:hypothetical protein